MSVTHVLKPFRYLCPEPTYGYCAQRQSIPDAAHPKLQMRGVPKAEERSDEAGMLSYAQKPTLLEKDARDTRSMALMRKTFNTEYDK